MLALLSLPYIVAEKPVDLKMWDLLVIRGKTPYTPEDLHSYREARIAPGVSAQSR